MELYRAVNDRDKRSLSREELEALQFIARSPALALQQQFAGSLA